MLSQKYGVQRGEYGMLICAMVARKEEACGFLDSRGVVELASIERWQVARAELHESVNASVKSVATEFVRTIDGAKVNGGREGVLWAFGWVPALDADTDRAQKRKVFLLFDDGAAVWVG